MNNVKSTISVTIPGFTIPETKEQFEQLTLAQKTILAKEHPNIYERFAHPPQPKKPWE